MQCNEYNACYEINVMLACSYQCLSQLGAIFRFFSLHTDIDIENIPQIKDESKPEPKQMISLRGMNRSDGKKIKFRETDLELRPNEAKRWCGSF